MALCLEKLEEGSREGGGSTRLGCRASLQMEIEGTSSEGCSKAAKFTLLNRCSQTIWPGIQAGAGKPQLEINGSLELNPNKSASLYAPAGWSGRFWARTGCSFDNSGQTGNCITGDCGGRLDCNGIGGAPPASLAEFTLDSPQDFYDISLVDGFNLPVSIVPSGGSGNCTRLACTKDLNPTCPPELREYGSGVQVVGCKSACLAFGKDQYCCAGVYNNPQVCTPTRYSRYFKTACPAAYSYPYDDRSSIFTCKGADYSIMFCSNNQHEG
ncbi:pathogenesis-related thaumatin superfamily protein [Striga asiatica]|uniref:Pathogenesis-related thaumatin superfamily protein n=1 Tax=Striga asiatica TaxID=4170 RepID=A0A5A7QUN4_STRAF|nr:pathogenesis-related thaumatin superfamily protein [Striga asiatica]